MGSFRYERPATVSEATSLLAAAGGRARVLAGGTDLAIALRAGAAPEVVVDIKRIPELGTITWTPSGDLILGACVLVQTVAEDARIRATFPALAEGAEAIGSLQIRWRATIAGNLTNASPCMDTAPPLLVLGAALMIAGPRGSRATPLADFFVGVKTTALGSDEIVTGLHIPKPPAGLRCGFDKIKRTWGHDLALANAALSYDTGTRAVRVAIGSCAVTPVLIPPLEGVAPDADALGVGQQLGELALQYIRPIDDVRASAEYRRDMAALLCRRLAARLFGTAGRVS